MRPLAGRKNKVDQRAHIGQVAFPAARSTPTRARLVSTLQRDEETGWSARGPLARRGSCRPAGERGSTTRTLYPPGRWIATYPFLMTTCQGRPRSRIAVLIAATSRRPTSMRPPGMLSSAAYLSQLQPAAGAWLRGVGSVSPAGIAGVKSGTGPGRGDGFRMNRRLSRPRRYMTGVTHSRVRACVPRIATRPLRVASSTPRPWAMAVQKPRANAQAAPSEIGHWMAATALTPPRTSAAAVPANRSAHPRSRRLNRS